MRRLTFSIVFGTLAILPSMPANAASPSPGQPTLTTFSILPGKQETGKPVQSSFRYTLGSGQGLSDTVAVVNPSRTTDVTVKLHVSDAKTPPQGGGLEFNDTSQQHQLGHWIHLGATTVTVPPYSVTWVRLQVTIPAGVRPGEYEGAVTASDARATTYTQGKLKYGIVMTRRCMILLRVNGQASPGLRIAHVAAKTMQKTRALTINVANAGTLIAYPNALVITLSRQGKAYTLRSALGMILAGASTAMPVPIGAAIPPGTYRTTVKISYLARIAPAPAAPQALIAVWNGAVTVPKGT